MANTSNINIRIDADLKNQAEHVFGELGLNLSAAMTVLLKNSVRCGGFPFDMRIPPKPRAMQDLTREELHAELEKGYQSMLAGDVHDFDEVFDKLESGIRL